MPEAQLGATTGGVWTAAEAQRQGLTLRQVRWRVESGEWQVLHRGVYATAGVVPDAPMRAWAAIAACGGRGRARAAGRTAARLLGLPLVDDADPLLPQACRTGALDDVASDRAGRAAGGLVVARLALAPEDRVLVHGVPSLSPRRTLVDLARVLPFEALVCAMDDALHRGLVDAAALRTVVEARTGRPHAALLRRAAAAADGRAESPLETLARLLLQPVLPGLVPQVRVLDHRYEVVARLDLADEALRLGVEADGGRYHAGTAALAADRRREARVAVHGWHLERVTWADVRRDGARTQARVLRVARRRAA